jgi:uncharacterized protein YutE (UPF0331/DUF86 family)
MVTQSTLRRIERFRRAVEKLEKISLASLEEYLKNTDLQDIAERNLQISVETVMDIGQRIIATKGWRVPGVYRDIAEILRENGVIDQEVEEGIKELISLRNIIIHAYAEINLEETYQILKDKAEFLRNVVGALLKYCEENGIDP